MFLLIPYAEALDPFLLQHENSADYAEHDKGREDRASSVADQGERHSRQWDEFHFPADRQESLEYESDGGPKCIQPVELVRIAARQQQEIRKNIEAQQDQADAEDKSHLLNDRGKDEVGLHERDARRHALHKARAEEPAEADREQRLRDLVAVSVDAGPRIQEYLHSHPHMREEEVAQHRCDRSQKEPSEQVSPLPAREEEDNDVDKIVNKRAAQISRQHKDPHMHDRSRGKENNMLVRILLAEGARQKEEEQYFDKFAGLEGHPRDRKAQLGSVRDRAEQKDGRQRRDARDSIEIGPLAERIKMVPEHREHHHEQNAGERDDHLLHRFLVVDPRNDHQPDAQEHQDVVEHQHVRALVQVPVYERRPYRDQDLQHAEREIVLVVRKERQCQVRVEREHTHAQPLQRLARSADVFPGREGDIGQERIEQHRSRYKIFAVGNCVSLHPATILSVLK